MMVETDQCDVIILRNLIQKVCSGSAAVVVDDVLGTILEALCNFLLNHGDDHDSLPKYLEASDHKFEVLQSTGFSFTTSEIRDNYLVGLRNRRQENSTVYQDLMRWKNAPSNKTEKNDHEQGIKVLNNDFRARVYIKQSSKEFDQFRRDLSNGYVSRSREMLFDVTEADR